MQFELMQFTNTHWVMNYGILLTGMQYICHNCIHLISGKLINESRFCYFAILLIDCAYIRLWIRSPLHQATTCCLWHKSIICHIAFALKLHDCMIAWWLNQFYYAECITPRHWSGWAIDSIGGYIQRVNWCRQAACRCLMQRRTNSPLHQATKCCLTAQSIICHIALALKLQANRQWYLNWNIQTESRCVGTMMA